MGDEVESNSEDDEPIGNRQRGADLAIDSDEDVSLADSNSDASRADSDGDISRADSDGDADSQASNATNTAEPSRENGPSADGRVESNAPPIANSTTALDTNPPTNGNHGHRVLVPIEILRGETISDALVQTFSSIPVVLLGYHEIPDQTTPDQARLQFESRARDELDELVDAFETAGGIVESRLVFTHDPMQSFERIAVERECDSVLLVNPAPVIEDVLVPIRGDVNVEHIAKLVGTVLEGTDASVELLHIAPSEHEREQGTGDSILSTAASVLVDSGVPALRIEQTVVVDDAPRNVIIEMAGDADLVVLGEDRPSIRDLIFGDTSTVVAKRTVCPVLVVRRRYLESDSFGGDEDDGSTEPGDDGDDRLTNRGADGNCDAEGR